MKKYILIIIISLIFANANATNIYTTTKMPAAPTCPQLLPSVETPLQIQWVSANVYSVYYNMQQNRTKPPFTNCTITINAPAASDIPQIISQITASGLTSYTSKAMYAGQLWNAYVFYCAYHNSTYNFPNIPPVTGSTTETAYYLTLIK